MKLFLSCLSIMLSISQCTRTRTDPKVQGGNNITDIEEFPFMGYFSVELTPTSERMCSGLLVDQFTAITAGHCVLVRIDSIPYQLLPLDKNRASLTMRVADRTDVRNPFYQRREIKQLFIHPKADYIAAMPIRGWYDIGAIKWAQKLILNAKIQLVPLIPQILNPFKAFHEIIIQGGRCESAGWGELQVDWSDPIRRTPKPLVLHGLEVDIMSKYDCCVRYFQFAYGKCMQILRAAISGFLCHVRHVVNRSMALGDSGSPICCRFKGNRYVVGMNVCEIPGCYPPPHGPREVYKPAFFVIDGVLRPYIRNMTGNQREFSRSQKSGVGLFGSIQILATFTYIKVLN